LVVAKVAVLPLGLGYPSFLVGRMTTSSSRSDIY